MLVMEYRMLCNVRPTFFLEGLRSLCLNEQPPLWMSLLKCGSVLDITARLLEAFTAVQEMLFLGGRGDQNTRQTFCPVLSSPGLAKKFAGF